jgi:hypothetical protein
VRSGSSARGLLLLHGVLVMHLLRPTARGNVVFLLKLDDQACAMPIGDGVGDEGGVAARFAQNRTLSRNPSKIRGFQKRTFAQWTCLRRPIRGISLSKLPFKIATKGNGDRHTSLACSFWQIVQRPPCSGRAEGEIPQASRPAQPPAEMARGRGRASGAARRIPGLAGYPAPEP